MTHRGPTNCLWRWVGMWERCTIPWDVGESIIMYINRGLVTGIHAVGYKVKLPGASPNEVRLVAIGIHRYPFLREELPII